MSRSDRARADSFGPNDVILLDDGEREVLTADFDPRDGNMYFLLTDPDTLRVTKANVPGHKMLRKKRVTVRRRSA